MNTLAAVFREAVASTFLTGLHMGTAFGGLDERALLVVMALVRLTLLFCPTSRSAGVGGAEPKPGDVE